MSDFLPKANPFLRSVITVIEENLADENFGVSQLADRLHMSRSNLLRKVKKETGLSVSVFIRNVRLHHGKKLLQNGSLTVSEISFQVGFNSTSYFTKCFREQYGYTPGEVGKRDTEERETSSETSLGSAQLKTTNEPKLVSKARFQPLWIILGVVLIGFSVVFFPKKTVPEPALAKTIAVLPFKNDSNDSTNVYLMNGLLEAILNNFHKIEDIKVTSRTTVEKFRGVAKTIPELSKELGVNYFIEGSGQKIGDEILLTIQLIEAPTDKHLWSKRYRREAKDVFQLQMEVAQNIAEEINAIITPEENQRLQKVPTNNLVAYDYYLMGLALIKDQTGAGLAPGIEQFKKAILEDGEFANAYAYIAISYYYLDIFRAEKQHTEEIKRYYEKAEFLEPELGETLIARAIYLMQIEEYEDAVEALENVLDYYPNVGWVHNFLSNIYAWQLPNTELYLTHALQGLHSAIAEQDSTTTSFTYLHLANAFSQTGFIDRAEQNIKKSLAYDPHNLFAEYLSIYIQLGKDLDLNGAKAALIQTLQKDTTRLDITQEVAKVSYTMGDYRGAWTYYKKLIDGRTAMGLDIYQNEDINIGFVLEQLGKKDEAKPFYDSFLAYAQNDESIYKDLSLSAFYAATGNIETAMNHFKAFSKQDNYQYWIVLFLDKDPVLTKMSDHPDFERTVKHIRDKFWAKNAKIRKRLKQERLI